MVAGPSTELKPVTIMQQGFYVFRFHLYQQKYQQYAKVPCFLAAFSGGYYKRLRRAISTKSQKIDMRMLTCRCYKYMHVDMSIKRQFINMSLCLCVLLFSITAFCRV